MPVTDEMMRTEYWLAALVINLSRKSVVRIDDLPDMTLTVCRGRTYIARNKINYLQMLPDMVNEKIIRFLRKSAFTLIYSKTRAQRLCIELVGNLRKRVFL